MKLYFVNKLLPFLMKQILVLILFSLPALYANAQGIYEGDAADLKPILIPNKIDEMYVADAKGDHHHLSSYLQNKKKFTNKPFLFLMWGTGDSQRGFKALKDLASNNIGKEYNVVALYIDWQGLNSTAMNKAIAKENATQLADQFLMLATTYSILENGFFVKQFPLAIFADATLKNLFIHQVMPYKNTVLMLKKIEAGLGNREKIWLTKEAAVVEETDAEAVFFKRFSVNGSQISKFTGNKEMILTNESFVHLNDKFLRHGELLVQSEKSVISANGLFKEGLVIDTFTAYYPTGKVRMIHPPNGILKMYDEEGKINFTGQIKSGLGNGLFTQFYNGKVVANYNYKLGQEAGIQKQFLSNNVVNEWFVSSEFEFADFIKDGLQKVKKNNLYGYTDGTGKIIIPIKYETADNFDKGFAKVSLQNKEYKVDKTGKLIEIIDPKVIVKEKTKLDKYDRVEAFSKKGFKKVELNKKFGFIDAEDNEIVPPIYDQVWDFYEGIVAVKLDGKMGYVNDKGTVIIPPKYLAGDMFINGKAKVAMKKNEEYKYGYVDNTGKEIIPIVYNYPRRSGDNYIIVKAGEKYGLLDWGNKLVVPYKYDDIDYYYEDRAIVKVDNNYGVIDEFGILITAIKYSKIEKFNDGMAVVTIKEDEYKYKIGFINDEGKEVIKANEYIDATSFYNGAALVQNSTYLWGVINKSNSVIHPFQFDEADEFSDGMARVGYKKKYGFVNTLGQLVIPIQYSAVNDFDEGFAAVKIDGEWRKINKKGEIVK